MLKRFMKRVDSNGKIYIPKIFVEMYGKDFYLELYENKLVIKPVLKAKEKANGTKKNV